MGFNMSWNSARVLVVGDLMLDRWVYTVKTRISPEAPIPIIEQWEHFAELGGAGNALRHLENLSTGPHVLISVRGPDPSGEEIVSLAEKLSSRIHLLIDPLRRTTTKERFFIDGVPVYRRDSEDLKHLSDELEESVIERVAELIEQFDVLLLSDYAKGLFSDSLIQDLLMLARAHQIPIVSDPGFGRVAAFAGCDVIKPNSKEWQEYVGNEGSEDVALGKLFAAGTGSVLVTHGKRGVQLLTPSFQMWAHPQEELEALDVTGAGDSVAAAVSLIVGSGLETKEHLDALNKIGGLVVSQNRTILPKI
mgnify:CR=1 FL=1